MRRRTPTFWQLVSLGVTLGAVAVFSGYTSSQLRGLRRLETDTVDRNRRDSLQLIRIQSNLTQLGLALRDMAEGAEPYPLAGYRGEFDRMRLDLEDALATEARLMPTSRRPELRRLLDSTFERFWHETAELWELAGQGREREARNLIRTRLEGERAAMATTISRLLVENNEAEAAATVEIQAIYGQVERNLYYFLAAVLAAILLTGFFVIRHDRRLFGEVARLSEERRQLAAAVITIQEDVFRTLARELHDEFGQVLTALGMMLLRVEKRLPEDIPARGDLREVREIADQTLDRVRGMSQMLHPPVLDDYGLERSIEWYLGQFRKQTGLDVHYEKSGVLPFIGDKVAIHVYRILQEALNNVARHAGTKEAWVRVQYRPEGMRMEVEDRGKGLPPERAKSGIGLVAMRERAELLGGRIGFTPPAAGGTLVSLDVPFERGDAR
jgi:signal transduction histidine kinase